MITGNQQFDPTSVRGVIFDLMCTLFNPGVPEEAVKQWAEHIQLPHQSLMEALLAHETAAGVGQPALLEDWMSRVLTTAGATVSTKQARARAHQLAVLSARAGHPYPRAHELIRALRHHGRHVAVLSIVSHRGRLAVKNLGFDEPWVDAALFSSEIGLLKPDPESYLLACRRLGLAPHQCLFVDDNLLFARQARRLGLHAAVVLHPQGHTANLISQGLLAPTDLTAQGLMAINAISEVGSLLDLPDWEP